MNKHNQSGFLVIMCALVISVCLMIAAHSIYTAHALALLARQRVVLYQRFWCLDTVGSIGVVCGAQQIRSKAQERNILSLTLPISSYQGQLVLDSKALMSQCNIELYDNGKPCGTLSYQISTNDEKESTHFTISQWHMMHAT